MSTRIAVATLAALVTALSFQGTASARNSAAAHASSQAIHRNRFERSTSRTHGFRAILAAIR